MCDTKRVFDIVALIFRLCRTGWIGKKHISAPEKCGAGVQRVELHGWNFKL